MEVESNPEARNASLADESNHFNWYTRFERLLQNDEWRHQFAAKLENRDIMQPLELAVLCQANLSTVQQVYEMNPDQLNQETLEKACKYGAQPGVISFLAKTKPELVSCNRDDPNKNLIALAMEDGPEGEAKAAESDVKALVEICPESLAVVSDWWIGSGTDDDNGDLNEDEHTRQSTALQQCLRQGYSKDLLEFMLNSFPDKTPVVSIHDWPDSSVGANGMLLIGNILPKIHGELFCECWYWTDHALMDFFQQLFLRENHITILKISLFGSDSQLEPKVLESLPKILGSQLKRPRIETLSIDFNEHLFLRFLDILPYLPCLHTLKVSVHCVLEPSLPALCHLLNTGKLRQLTISATAQEIRSRKRKEPSEEVQLPLQPMFDTLAKNNTLTKLHLALHVFVLDPVMAANSNKLAEALQENTSLQDIVGIPGLGNFDDKLTYYLLLNKRGRKQAQDPTTILADFVEILASVEPCLEIDLCSIYSNERFNRGEEFLNRMSRHWAINVQYGLLHEAVGKWAPSCFS